MNILSQQCKSKNAPLKIVESSYKRVFKWTTTSNSLCWKCSLKKTEWASISHFKLYKFLTCSKKILKFPRVKAKISTFERVSVHVGHIFCWNYLYLYKLSQIQLRNFTHLNRDPFKTLNLWFHTWKYFSVFFQKRTC